MVSNRLPVDRTVNPDGTTHWKTSPGGLVTAVEPIVQKLGCTWIGWPGDTSGEVSDPFEIGQMTLVPVTLNDEEVREYYEGFANGTLWPLYHDVIAVPEYHRTWWVRYEQINRKFAQAVAKHAQTGATVWVHDYQLQLVPAMLRSMRSDLTIGFFLHIPFPATRIFAQLPWRRQIIHGLLGADVVGFQTVPDAESFRVAADIYAKAPAHGNLVMVPERKGTRAVLAQEFPISIDAKSFAKMAANPDVQKRAIEIKDELGGRQIVLGVDRLDYTKGIRHRIKAYGELLAEDEIDPSKTVLVQVATPSREKVDAYQELRSQVEVKVSRINGDYGTLGHTPIVYLHQGFSREEMVALYLAADVLFITALRDGMNLVAKEYVACRPDFTGVLILSEFAGARYELTDSILVNPHDIEGMKASLLRALHMPLPEQRRRMESLHHAVFGNDVSHWAGNYLGALGTVSKSRGSNREKLEATAEAQSSLSFVPKTLEAALRRLATSQTLIVASDFDGTLAPFVDNPADARMLPRAKEALSILGESSGVKIAIVSGRSINSLKSVGVDDETWIYSGSHGAELSGLPKTRAPKSTLTTDEQRRLDRLKKRLNRVFGHEEGVRLEEKPFGMAVHTRQVKDSAKASEILEAASSLAADWGIELRSGKQVREFSVRRADKGASLMTIREQFPDAPLLFLGDDTTDEDAFAVLEQDDVGVKVGDGETNASERVPDPQTAAAALALLATFRTGRIVGDYVETEE